MFPGNEKVTILDFAVMYFALLDEAETDKIFPYFRDKFLQFAEQVIAENKKNA